MERSTCLTLVMLALAAAAPAQQEPRIPEKLKRSIAAALAQDPAVASVYALCPADAFLQQAPLLARFSKERASPVATCRADPGACFSDCTDRRDAGACTALGHILQGEDGGSAATPQRLFSLGCAAGSGSACTNRAAAIRNTVAPGDPFFHASRPVQEECEARSFAIGCRKDDSWSCAMLGQAYEHGEGVPKDPDTARSNFEKACALAPGFVACDFARNQMSRMGAATGQ